MLEADGRSTLAGRASRTGVTPIYPYNLLIISLPDGKPRSRADLDCAVFYPYSRILRGISKISKRCVGVDAHIDPANGTDFTGISGESVGAQWGDVGIAPYAKFKDYAKF